jgi:hypothetical protein
MIVLEGATGFPSGIIFSNQDLPVAIFIPSKTTRAMNFQSTAAEALSKNLRAGAGIGSIMVCKTVR